MPVGEDLVLVLRGRVLAAEDQRVLAAFAAQVAVAYEQRRLAEAAAAAGPLAEADRMRTALLNAVSHDLRTPIASAKAAVSSLRSQDVDVDRADRQELLATADEALDRLTALVANLLDLSRLQAGVLADRNARRSASRTSSAAPWTTPARRRATIELDVRPTLPEVLADPGLLERVIANLVENALRYTPAGQPVRIAASAHGDTVELRVIDRGPGIPPDRPRGGLRAVPAPRRPRHQHGAGVGLGLAIARGFAEAMGGSVTLDDTPGGGLTAVIAAPAPRHAAMTRVLVVDDEPPLLRALAHEPDRPRLRRHHRVHSGRGASRTRSAAASGPDGARPRPARHATASRSSAECANASRRCRSSCCRPAAAAATRWPRSTSAPTTTSPSRSTWTNCSPGSAPYARRASRDTPGQVVWVGDHRDRPDDPHCLSQRRSRSPPDADRMAHARGAAAPPRPADHWPATC